MQCSSTLYLLLGVVVVVGVCVVESLPQERNFSYNTKTALTLLNDILPTTTSNNNLTHSRKKRFLGLPRNSNFEVKWSLNFPFETFTFYKAKFQIALPITIPLAEGLLVGGAGDGKQNKANKRSVIDPINVVLEEGSAPSIHAHYYNRKAARHERSSVYSYIEAAFEKAGEDGRSCLLRAICDVAEVQFDQGLLGEMINTVLTASLAGQPEDPTEGREYDRFLEAELHGKLNGKCEERYNKCKTSPFNLVPQIVHVIV
ncbi:hypothetical protein Pmani_016456 [Petrolisthes manimaculis]|uniref:Uncharacterized protein n=1 Tax=Petrolisthes manimaculis TaxID=1843537 RepID=A0AAE1PRP7_9EUCA|nr:hypothetical protein Pmani_016456 [Petrolisthes manimaculis]